MEKYAPDAVLLPTGGVNRHNHHLPNRTGRCRLYKFVEMMRKYPLASGIIAGGMPGPDGFTEAKAYMEWLTCHNPLIASRVGIINGEGNFTVDDVHYTCVELAHMVGEKKFTIACITRAGHYGRLEPGIKLYGHTPFLVQSGEPSSPFSVIVDWLLGIVTRCDTSWEGFWGRLLRKNVAYRAKLKRTKK